MPFDSRFCLARPNSTPLFLLMLSALAGLLPDIDATNAKIQHLGPTGGLLKSIGGLSGHRRFFHSILITLLLAIPFLFIESTIPGITIAFTAGYASHIIIDGFTKTRGVAYFSPFSSRDLYLLPRKWRSDPDHWLDILLFFIGAIGLITFLFLWRQAAADWYFSSIPNSETYY